MSDSTKQVPKKEAKKPVKRTRSRNPLPTKVVIRHLPPSLTSDQFKEQISPISDHNYFYYVRGDPLLGEFSFSRAYINFINQDDILRFREKFDNFVFVDDKGNEYTAIVELALYQGAPKRRKKVDAKCKTIESDPDFLQFVENKENLSKPDVLPSVEECLEEIETKEKAGKQATKITPLLEYINNAEHRKITEIKKKSARDESREKRRKEERVRKRKEKERDRKKPREAPSGGKPPASTKSGKELTEMSSASANSIPVKSKDSRAEHKEDGAAAKEPKKRERHRRRHDEKKKPADDRAAESKPGEKSRFERGGQGRPSKSAAGNSGNAGKKEEPQTFTVRILKNENRSEREPKPSDSSNATNAVAKSSSASSKEAKSEAKSSESGTKERRVPDKIRNKDRPTIQIYRPSPRSATGQIKEQKETAKKPSQERSARGS